MRTSIGHVIIYFFKNKNDEKARIMLFEKIKQTLQQIVRIHGLTEVCDEEQVGEAAVQLYLELTLDLDSLKKRSFNKPKDMTRHLSSQHKLFEATKNAAAKSLFDEEVPYRFSNYFKRRCLSVLKYFATGEHRFYLETNQKVQSCFNYLRKKGEIHAIKHGQTNAYSVSCSGAQPISQSSEAKAIISRDLKGSTSEHILELLQKNSHYLFTSRDISEAIIKMNMIHSPTGNKEKDIAFNKNESDSSANYTNCNEGNINKLKAKIPDHDTGVIAHEEFTTFKESLNLNDSKIKQELMALLAVYIRGVPSQNADNILTKAQLKMSVTDCIESFLNDERFSNLSSRKIGRTTAHSRFKAAEEKLKSLLGNNSAVVNQLLTKLHFNYLKKLFKKWTDDENG